MNLTLPKDPNMTVQTSSIAEMTLEHHGAALALWQNTPGVGVNDRDGREAISHYLESNPGLSLVALGGAELVGTLLAGSDGRRGYLHHLAVAPSHRGMGLARAMVNQAQERLHQLGVDKSHIFVYADNPDGQAFWSALGWQFREDLRVMSGTWKA